MADNMVLDWMKFSSSVGGEADEKENYLKVIRGEEPDWVPPVSYTHLTLPTICSV